MFQSSTLITGATYEAQNMPDPKIQSNAVQEQLEEEALTHNTNRNEIESEDFNHYASNDKDLYGYQDDSVNPNGYGNPIG